MRSDFDTSWSAAEVLPFPLGATRIDEQQTFNFSLLYSFDYLSNKSGRIWHCRLALEALEGAKYYAYRVDGPLPAGRFEWHAFDPDKVLLDPYARSV